MICIDHNTDYSKIRDALKEIYTSYLSKDHEAPPSYNRFIKVNTPLFYIGEGIINDAYIDDYRKALLFIGKCHREVPLNKRMIDTRDFSMGEIIYKTREFGYVPKSLQFSFRKLVDMAFSASSFRLMCVKAEIAVLLYYMALSSVIGKDFEDYPEDVMFILGAFAFAINKYHSMQNPIKGMASYIWELTTFVNVYTNCNQEIEDNFSMPSHHVFQSTRRYGSIANFGDYDCFTEKCDFGDGEEEFYSHLSKVPKCPTNITYNNNVWFYIPTESDVKSLCTECFNRVMNAVKLCSGDLMHVGLELREITSYESEFLLAKDESYAEGCEFFFKSENEAKEFIKTIKVPETFVGKNLYFCVMIKENGRQELKVMQ